MASSIKLNIALITLIAFVSCSTFKRDSSPESKYFNNNKEKVSGLILEISFPDDTLYANKSTYSYATAKLTYIGEGSYYFKLGPLTARMDWNFMWPNSVSRTFYHMDEKCKLNKGSMLEMPDQRTFRSKYSRYMLRSGKSIAFCCEFDAKNLRCSGSNWDEDNNVFGEYEMQLVYITESNDTIYSDKIKFWYLEKDE